MGHLTAHPELKLIYDVDMHTGIRHLWSILTRQTVPGTIDGSAKVRDGHARVYSGDKRHCRSATMSWTYGKPSRLYTHTNNCSKL